jgi:hypothetical protein
MMTMSVEMVAARALPAAPIVKAAAPTASSTFLIYITGSCSFPDPETDVRRG